MLIGHYIVSITSKRRTSLPSVFRKEVGNEIVITRWYEGCLIVVGISNFTKIIESLVSEEKLAVKALRETQRFVLGSAYRVTLDEQGRFIIPKTLYDFGGLRDKLVFVGMGDKVEIWDQNLWNAKQPQLILTSSSNVERLSRQNND